MNLGGEGKASARVSHCPRQRGKFSEIITGHEATPSPDGDSQPQGARRGIGVSHG